MVWPGTRYMQSFVFKSTDLCIHYRRSIHFRHRRSFVGSEMTRSLWGGWLGRTLRFLLIKNPNNGDASIFPDLSFRQTNSAQDILSLQNMFQHSGPGHMLYFTAKLSSPPPHEWNWVYHQNWQKMKMGANIFKGIFLKLIDSYQQRRQLSYGVSSNSNPSKKIETTSQSLFRWRSRIGFG